MCNQCTEVRFASFQSGGFNSGSNKSTGIKTSKSHLYAVPKSSSKLLLANPTNLQKIKNSSAGFSTVALINPPY